MKSRGKISHSLEYSKCKNLRIFNAFAIHSTLKTPRILTIRFLDAIKNFTVLDELKSLKHQEFLQLNPQELSVLDGHQDVKHLEASRFSEGKSQSFAKRFIQTSLNKK